MACAPFRGERCWRRASHQHRENPSVPEQAKGPVPSQCSELEYHPLWNKNPATPYESIPGQWPRLPELVTQRHEQGLQPGPRRRTGRLREQRLRPPPGGCSWRGASSPDGSKFQAWGGNAGQPGGLLAGLTDLLFSTGFW